MDVGSFLESEDIPIDDIDDEEEETAEPEDAWPQVLIQAQAILV